MQVDAAIGDITLFILVMGLQNTFSGKNNHAFRECDLMSDDGVRWRVTGLVEG